MGKTSLALSKWVHLGNTASGGALAQELALAVRPLDHHGHHAARKVKRNLIDLAILFERQLAGHLAMPEHGAVEHVFEAGLEMADEESVAQDVEVLVFEDVAIEFEDDVVHRQGPGLVGA
jgi:hypothetical protein